MEWLGKLVSLVLVSACHHNNCDAKDSPKVMIQDHAYCDGRSVKINNNLIGPEGVSVGTSKLTITIKKWYSRSAGNYYGFSYSTSGTGTLANYFVKTDTRTYEDYTNPWYSPDGNSISQITFCIWD